MKRVLAALLLGLFCVAPLHAEEDPNGPFAYTFRTPEAKSNWRAGLPEDCKEVTQTCVWSPSQKTVYALAEFCGADEGMELEFIVLGPLSDRAYEALTIAWDQPSVIAQAVKAMGVPKGEPAKTKRGLGMAQGERFTIAFKRLSEATFRPISEFMTDTFSPEGQAVCDRGFPFVDGDPAMDDLMPAPVVATYTEPPAVFGLPYIAAKSLAYGAFRASCDMPRGEPVVVAFQWKPLPEGLARVYHHRVEVTAETIAHPEEFLGVLQKLCEDPRDVFLEVALDPSLTLAQVVPFARLLLDLEAKGGFVIDSPEGQLPIRAFTPQEEWKVREDRVFQPWEIEVVPGKDGAPAQVTLCQILEDWTVEGNDPALTRKCYPGMTPQTIRKVLEEVDQNDGKVYVAFFYTAPGVTVGDLVPYAEALVEPCPTQWIFSAR